MVSFSSTVSSDITNIIFNTNELAKLATYTPPGGSAVPNTKVIPLDSSMNIISSNYSQDNKEELNLMTQKSEVTVAVGGVFDYLGTEYYVDSVIPLDEWTQASKTTSRTKRKTHASR